MASKTPEMFTLSHPKGFDVTVLGETRAKTLLDRGYKLAKGQKAPAKPKASAATEEAAEETEGPAEK